jgi:hypothetical protein
MTCMQGLLLKKLSGPFTLLRSARTLCQMMPRMHTVHVMRSPVVLGLFLRDIVDPGLGDHGIMRRMHAGLSRAEGKFLVNRDEAVGKRKGDLRGDTRPRISWVGQPRKAKRTKRELLRKRKQPWQREFPIARSNAYQQQKKKKLIPNRGIEPRPCRN